MTFKSLMGRLSQLFRLNADLDKEDMIFFIRHEVFCRGTNVWSLEPGSRWHRRFIFGLLR